MPNNSNSMIEQVLNHPSLPEGVIHVETHSKFGKQLGYLHFINVDQSTEEISYVGLILDDKHAGAPGRGHGGVTMAMLDEAMGRAASRALNQLCYTASMTTNFCAGTKVGEFALATAKVTRAGKNIVFVDGTLYSENTLIATATGTWANSGKPIPTF